MGDGSFTIFFNRPISAVFMVIAFFLFGLPAIKLIKDKMKSKDEEAPA
jgi:TctA family transporter